MCWIWCLFISPCKPSSSREPPQERKDEPIMTIISSSCGCYTQSQMEFTNLDWVNVTITCYYTGFGGYSAHRPLLQPNIIDHRNRFAPKLVRRDNCLLQFWLMPVLDYTISAVFLFRLLFATLYKNKILTKLYNILCHNVRIYNKEPLMIDLRLKKITMYCLYQSINQCDLGLCTKRNWINTNKLSG